MDQICTPSTSLPDAGNTSDLHHGVDTNVPPDLAVPTDIGRPNDVAIDDVGPDDIGPDAADMFIDPNRPIGRTGCAPIPISDITEPKATVGNGNAASCTFETLRQAVAAGGLITFDCGVTPHTIVFQERLVIDNDVHLDGAGMITFDGDNSTRLFLIDAPFQSESPHLVLEDLTLRNGFAMTDDFLCGAAVARPAGTLTIINSNLENHRCVALTADDDPVGGAIGAIDGGPLRIFGSNFQNNAAAGGGALFLRDLDVDISMSRFELNQATALSGGAITAFGQTNLTICGGQFQDNVAPNFGGAIFYRDAMAPRAAVHIAQSGFERNAATEDGGAADIEGAELTIDSTTFHANVAERGGALWLGDDEFAMINVTFSSNEATAESGGAIYYSQSTGTIDHATFHNNLTGSTPGSVVGSRLDAVAGVTLRNSILASTLVNVEPTFCLIEQLDGGGNIQWPDTTDGCTDSVSFADPQLGGIAQNGGLTRTIEPMPGSPAISYADQCPRFDQRGVVRPADSCTAGAVEVD